MGIYGVGDSVARLCCPGSMHRISSAQRVAHRWLAAAGDYVDPERFTAEMSRVVSNLLERYRPDVPVEGRDKEWGVGFSRGPTQQYIAVQYVPAENAQKVYQEIVKAVEDRNWQVTDKDPRANVQTDWYPRRSPYFGRAKIMMDVMPREGQDVDTPEVLYHITDRENVASILSTGLRPVKARPWLPDRVYLFKDVAGVNEGLFLNGMRHSSGKANAETLTRTTDTVVLEIDPSKLDKPLKLRDDPEWSGTAVYSADPIPGRAISVSRQTFRKF